MPWWPLFAASGPSIEIPRMSETALESCCSVNDTRRDVVDERPSAVQNAPDSRPSLRRISRRPAAAG